MTHTYKLVKKRSEKREFQAEETASSKTLFFHSRNNKIDSMSEAYNKKGKHSMRGSQRTSKE